MDRENLTVKQIIFNADDFGLSSSINEAVYNAAKQGLLTSASLCVTGPAAKEAADIALSLPDLSIGLHITLVGEPPASRASRIPTLTDAQGRLFRSGKEFAIRWLTGRISPSDVRREISEQWTLANDLGVPITHFDSHDHIHVLPGVLEICLGVAAANNVRRLRIPGEIYREADTNHTRRVFEFILRALSWRSARLAKARKFSFPTGFSGFRGAGAINAESLIRRIETAGEGITEIALHPAVSNLPRPDMKGWGYQWEDEYKALIDSEVARALSASGGSAVSFRQLETLK